MDAFLEKIVNRPVNLVIWVLSFLGIVTIRIFIEFFMVSSALDFNDLMVESLHTVLFFALEFLLIWLILCLILRKNPRHLANFILLSFWLIILPPLIDMLKTGGKIYWSFYVLNDWQGVLAQFFSFFGHFPSGIMYFGTKIVFILAIILVFLLIFVRSRSYWKAILGGILTYVAIFFMGNFPNLLTFGYYFLEKSKKIGEIKAYNVAQLVGSPAKIFGMNPLSIQFSFAYNLNLFYYLVLLSVVFVLFFLFSRKKFTAVLKNFRYPQVVYHVGLFFVGLGLGWLSYPDNLSLNLFSVTAVAVLVASIILAWKTSVVINDIYDFSIDSVSSPWRPLPQKIFSLEEYKKFGIIVFIFSLLGALIVGAKFMALLLVYQVLAFFYSAEPYRLKKIPGVATFISSICSLVILFMGFTLFSGDQNMAGLSWRVILLIIIAFTLSLPVKDFKDIEGDQKYGIWTIPVIFGEDKARLIVAIGVFISFVSSVFFLNALALFFWAIAFGGATFLVLINKKIKTTNLFWWVLSLVFVYGLILVKIVFF